MKFQYPPWSAAGLGCTVALCLPPSVLGQEPQTQRRQDPDGWTVLPPAPERTVYVSASDGSDSNDGDTPARPLQSLRVAMRRVLDGAADRLLLKRGDAWNESLPPLTRSGTSPAEPLVIAAFGEGPRPIVRTGQAPAVVSMKGHRIANLVVCGIEFTAHEYDGSGQHRPHAINLWQSCENVLLEDLYVHNYYLSVQIRGNGDDDRTRDVAIRRCIFARNYVAGQHGHTQGLLAVWTDGLVIEQCTFFRNGHDPNCADSAPNHFRHAAYFQNGTRNITCRENIFLEAASNAIQLRGGGIVEDNLFLRNPIAILFGGGHEPSRNKDGVTGSVTGNVIMDGRDGGQPAGWGIHAANIRSGRISDNIVAHCNLTHGTAHPLYLHPDNWWQPSVGLNDLIIEGNVVYDWRGPVHWMPFTTRMTGVVLRNNDFQYPTRGEGAGRVAIMAMSTSHVENLTSANNRFFSAEPASRWFSVDGRAADLKRWRQAVGDNSSTAVEVIYPDPDRTVTSYLDELEKRRRGTSTYEQFVGRLLRQGRHNWNPRLTAAAINDYLREGFGR